MNSHTSFVLFGGITFTMASTFLFIGPIPVWVTQKPIYSIYVCPKYEFSIWNLTPLSLSFCRVSSNFSKQSYQSYLVVINRSSMYAWINSNPQNIYFIFSWKVPGELLTPIGRRLYRSFPHGRIIVHMLLALSLRWIW